MIRFYLKNHYHVRCVKCGEVSGVDVDEISDLIERILACHPKSVFCGLWPTESPSDASRLG